jgi:hypothetical protein
MEPPGRHRLTSRPFLDRVRRGAGAVGRGGLDRQGARAGFQGGVIANWQAGVISILRLQGNDAEEGLWKFSRFAEYGSGQRSTKLCRIEFPSLVEIPRVAERC